jgi:hypothetical protein
MKNLLITLIILFTLVATGCHDWIHELDLNPPLPPTGLRTATGDNFIELFWNANREPDVAGYNIYVSSNYDGRYDFIGTSGRTYYADERARNGSVYYYAVTALDDAGNESDLSRDVAYDIPRPEGYDVMLASYQAMPGAAGYDFSAYAVVPYDGKAADMYYEYFNSVAYMNVGTDTDIQDVGATQSILEIGTAPSSGWSVTHDVRLMVGHTYVIWTWDDHYAKFRVKTLSPGRVVFDWAYQLIPSNPLLKRPAAASRGDTTAAD